MKNTHTKRQGTDPNSNVIVTFYSNMSKWWNVNVIFYPKQWKPSKNWDGNRDEKLPYEKFVNSGFVRKSWQKNLVSSYDRNKKDRFYCLRKWYFLLLIHCAIAGPRGPTKGSRFFRFDTQMFGNVGTSGVVLPLQRDCYYPLERNPGFATAALWYPFRSTIKI